MCKKYKTKKGERCQSIVWSWANEEDENCTKYLFII